MGRPRKNADGKETGGNPPAPGGNQYNPEAVQGFVSRIENLLDDKLAEHMDYMKQCKAILADIKLVKDEAKEAGIPRKALNSVLKCRDLERKAEKVRADLEGEDQDSHDKIRQALGDLADTPLGQNVIRKTFGEAIREPGAPLDPAA